MQVHADGKKIRRSVSKPLPEFSKEQQDSLKLRFIYAVSVVLCTQHFALCLFLMIIDTSYQFIMLLTDTYEIHA